MAGLVYLIPAALLLGLVGPTAFLSALRHGQFDDLDGAAHRIPFDDESASASSPTTGVRTDRRASPRTGSGRIAFVFARGRLEFRQSPLKKIEREGLMRRWWGLGPVGVVAAAWLTLSAPSAAIAGVQSITVFDCGRITSPDRSLWSPGVDVGVFHEMAASCYLIRHDDGLMMWDVGISDSVADMPDGLTVAGGLITQWVEKTLAAQMEKIGVRPEDVGHLGLSHMHPDHTGNANRFTSAVVYIQQAEYEAAFGPDATSFNFRPDTYDELAINEIVKLNGSHDVFGDGSVVIMSAPGHTPGHQVLYVELPESGPLLLSGDLWHFRSNYEHGRVPGFNYDRELTRESMEKIQAFIDRTGATLWIQHDKEQAAEIPHAPQSVR